MFKKPCRVGGHAEHEDADVQLSDGRTHVGCCSFFEAPVVLLVIPEKSQFKADLLKGFTLSARGECQEILVTFLAATVIVVQQYSEVVGLSSNRIHTVDSSNNNVTLSLSPGPLFLFLVIGVLLGHVDILW